MKQPVSFFKRGSSLFIQIELCIAGRTCACFEFVVVAFQPGDALDYSVSDSSVVLLMVLMGVAYSFGCLLAGSVLVSSSRRRPVTSSECVIARRHFCQAASCACAAALMLFAGAEGFADRTLFAGIYGLLAGALEYALDAFWRDCRTSVMASRNGYGAVPDYIVLAQVLPTLIGPPIVGEKPYLLFLIRTCLQPAIFITDDNVVLYYYRNTRSMLAASDFTPTGT
jgi:hypothetical protein